MVIILGHKSSLSLLSVFYHHFNAGNLINNKYNPLVCAVIGKLLTTLWCDAVEYQKMQRIEDYFPGVFYSSDSIASYATANLLKEADSCY